MARPKVNPDFADLTCKLCGNPFKVKWSKRNKQLYCSRTCAANDPEVKEKNRQGVAKTFNEKYGGHAMTTDKVKENFKKSMLEKYGCEHALESPELLNKLKKTTYDNFGVESVLSKESPVRKKIIDDWVKKYGVDHPAKSRDVIEKITKVKYEKHYTELKTLFDKFDLDWLTPMERYEGYHFSKRYEFKCKKCGNLFESTVYSPHNVFCEICHPERKTNGESSLLDFLREEIPNKIIIHHDRKVLDGKELDFYIPELKLAIEYNGLYWHREGDIVSKNYHLNKTTQCSEAGIKLIHILESEWLGKQSIVKSILRQSLNGLTAKIHGRECEVRKISDEPGLISNFLDECHLQGKDRSSVQYGLFYKKTLVSAMTFCKSRFDAGYEWEISRFCNSLNTKIHGAASKLFSAFIQDFQPNSIVSYSDRRYFSGEVYKSIGMTFAEYTPPGYYYISPDYKSLLNRQRFQKHKLSEILDKFDPTLSEWENMKQNGFDRIWDCGHSKWVWTKK